MGWGEKRVIEELSLPGNFHLKKESKSTVWHNHDGEGLKMSLFQSISVMFRASLGAVLFLECKQGERKEQDVVGLAGNRARKDVICEL